LLFDARKKRLRDRHRYISHFHASPDFLKKAHRLSVVQPATADGTDQLRRWPWFVVVRILDAIDCIVHFEPMYSGILRRFHADPHFITANVDHHNPDVITDTDDFISMPRQN